MKMIYVGTLANNPDRDTGWISSFKKLNWVVFTFSSEVNLPRTILGKIKNRLGYGKEYESMKRNLVKLVEREKPQWVHFRLPIQFDYNTIKIIKSKGCIVTQYFNDDPFSKKGPIGIYFNFKKAIPFYDINFVYREHNIENYKKFNAKEVYHCPPTYDLDRHYLPNNFPLNNYLNDVTFIGHWENDWRLLCLERLHQSGFKVLIRGGGWNNKIFNSKISHLFPVDHAFGIEYNQLYSSSIAGLCFFSKINRDSWTERALEIVAVGGVLVCERTNEAMTYFKDKEEALFFSTIPELIENITFLKNNPHERLRIQKNGYNRLLKSNNTIFDRSKFISNKFRSKLLN